MSAITSFFKRASNVVMRGVVFKSRNIIHEPTYNFVNIILNFPNWRLALPELEDEQSRTHATVSRHQIKADFCSIVVLSVAAVGAAVFLVSHLHPVAVESQVSPSNAHASLPPSIPIYGRDEPIHKTIDDIFSQTSTVKKHICIKGGPGMGKTATATGIMHHPRIVEHFGNARHWVNCQEASSITDELKASKLLEYISESFGIDLTGSSDPRKNIKYFLDNNDVPRIIVLDNFETMWEPSDAQEEVERVLLFLAQFPRLTIVVTTRNAHNPATQKGVLWHRLKPIDPLSPDASRALFTSLSLSEFIDNCLDDLLYKIDYVPLAIVLMASFGQENYTTCQILEMWQNRLTNSEGSETRHPRGGSDPFNKLDNSIAMSLEGPLIKSTPNAPVLLRIVAGLPGGMKRKNLQKIASLIPGADRVAEVLIRASLLTNSPDTLTMHSTIRYFMLRNYPLDGSHKESVQKFYYNLIHDAGGGPGAPHFLERAQNLAHEDTNAQAILLDGLADNFICWVPISLDYSNHLIWNVPSLDIPEITVEMIKKYWAAEKIEPTVVSGQSRWYSPWWWFDVSLKHLRGESNEVQDASITMTSQVKLFWPLASLRLGVLYFRRDKYLDATIALEESVDLSQKLNDSSLVAHAQSMLGEISRLQGENGRALQLYSEAYKQYENAGDPRGMSSCLRAIGIVYFSDGRLSDAIEIMHLAKEKCPLGDHTCIADYEREMGRVLRSTNQTESIRVLERARGYYLTHGPRGHAAIALYQMSIAQYLKGDYGRAEAGFHEALEEFRSIRNDAQMGYCVYHLGEMNLMRGLQQQALRLFHRSEGMFRLMENKFMTGLSLKRQADLYAKLCQPDKAMDAYLNANSLLKGVDAKEGLVTDTLSIDGMCELPMWYHASTPRSFVAFLVCATVLAVTIYDVFIGSCHSAVLR